MAIADRLDTKRPLRLGTSGFFTPADVTTWSRGRGGRSIGRKSCGPPSTSSRRGRDPRTTSRSLVLPSITPKSLTITLSMARLLSALAKQSCEEIEESIHHCHRSPRIRFVEQLRGGNATFLVAVCRRSLFFERLERLSQLVERSRPFRRQTGRESGKDIRHTMRP